MYGLSAMTWSPHQRKQPPQNFPKNQQLQPRESLTHDYTTEPASQEQPSPTCLTDINTNIRTLQVSKSQEILSQGTFLTGVSATAAVSSSSAGGQPPQSALRLLSLKPHQAPSVTGAHVAQIQAQGIITSTAQLLVAGTANGGKVASFNKVLTGTPLRSGVSIVSGNTVLAATRSLGTRLLFSIVQPSRLVKTAGPTQLCSALLETLATGISTEACSYTDPTPTQVT